MKLIREIMIDALLVACMYAWRVEHIEAGRIFAECWLWFICSMHWLALLLLSDEQLRSRRSPARALYDAISTVAMTAALLWLGWTTLAIALFVGWIFVTGRVDTASEEAA